MATGLRQLIFIEHPNVIFPSIATALAIPALASAPSFVPTTLLISCLLVYSKMIARRPRMAVHLIMSWLLVSVGQTIGDFAVSRNAVASPVGAFISAFILSLVSTGIHFLFIYIDTLSGRLSVPWARVTFFPALWATGIQIIANVSPLGYLMTWSPTTGVDAYEWMRPVFGPWGVNWVVAALAIVGAELVGSWFINETPEEGDIRHDPELDPLMPPQAVKVPNYAAKHGARHVALLAGTVLVLAVPSYFIRPVIIAPYSTSSTPIVAGCILPQARADGALTFEDYLTETSQFVQRSKRALLLWPEGAVRFESESDRQAKLKRLAQVQQNGYVAISYEQPDPNAGQRSGLRRNGVLVQGPDGIVLDYHKRHLVPFVESFPLSKGAEDPAVVAIDMPVQPTGKGKIHLRSISLTASICLDFAFPRALSGISQRAAIVLAPAQTWHPDVSRAMWEQARARVSEMGGTALFCDGGEGGFSGVASSGIREPTQVGPGSWVRTIGVEWPLDDRKTVYAAVGDWMMFFIVWMVMGVGTFGEMAVIHVLRRFAPSGGSLSGVVRRVSAVLTRDRAIDAEGHQARSEEASLI